MILEPPVCLGRFQARVMEDPLQFSRLMPYGAEGVADHVGQRENHSARIKILRITYSISDWSRGGTIVDQIMIRCSD